MTDPRAGPGAALRFHSALASQCFINEYVFSGTDDEMTLATRLKDELGQALEAGTPVSPSLLLAVASYFPLLSISNAAPVVRPQIGATHRRVRPFRTLGIRRR